MVDLAKNLLPLKELNQDSLTQPEVDVIVEDAWLWVQRQPKQYFDLIITDFPDPDEVSLAKLYSLEFFKLIDQLLTETGALVLQSTSPYATPTAFWCVYKTLTQAFPEVYPYNVYIPSFGLWGFQGYRARIRNHGHSCFLCEIVIRSQFHTTYEPEA
jgi:Predicted spermidine synthase with an N-terminal membrane domain